MRRVLLVLGSLVLAYAARGQDFNVFAAASLKEAATSLAKSFERQYPQVHVALNFGGSQQLAAQIKQGAPVDILLSAGFEPLKGLDYAPSSLRVFATNRLVIVVPSDPSKIQSLQDLAKAGLSLVFADRRVPVGDYTRKMLDKAQSVYGDAWRARIERSVVSKEQDVRAVLAKIALGEADAGIVYTSDVRAAKGKVRMIDISPRFNVEARYPAVRFNRSGNEDIAKDFMRFLLSSQAQRLLTANGFGSQIIPGPPASITINGKTNFLSPDVLKRYPEKPISATVHGNNVKLRGRDLTVILKNAKGLTVAMLGADGYSQTVRLRDARDSGMFLVATGDGNYEVVFPKQPPSTWVNWIRQITVR